MSFSQQVAALLNRSAWGADLYRQLRSARIYGRRGLRACIEPARADDRPGILYCLQADQRPTFFGYYDKTPFSANNHHVLAMAMQTDCDWRPGASLSAVDVGYFLWEEVISGESRFHSLASTTSWSWQQGCMLQWLPWSADNLVVFNQFQKQHYGAQVLDVASGLTVQSYPRPIYALNPVTQQAATLDFARLQRLRPGYGYCCIPDATKGESAPGSTGITLLDMASGKTELVVNLAQLQAFQPSMTMRNSEHYVNHLNFNPAGTLLVFLHLWQAAGASSRQGRLMCLDLRTHQLSVIDDAAVVSHYSWLTASKLVATRYHPIAGWEYVTYQLALDSALCEPLKSGSGLRVDGHPSLSPASDRLVTDTYPDRYGEQHLYVLSHDGQKRLPLGRFFSPPRYRGEQRCDLHPRWDRSGRRICFDSVHTGRRSLCVLDLEGESGW